MIGGAIDWKSASWWEERNTKREIITTFWDSVYVQWKEEEHQVMYHKTSKSGRYKKHQRHQTMEKFKSNSKNGMAPKNTGTVPMVHPPRCSPGISARCSSLFVQLFFLVFNYHCELSRYSTLETYAGSDIHYNPSPESTRHPLTWLRAIRSVSPSTHE